MYCREICSNYLAPNPASKKDGRYELGYKRCSSCEIYLIGNGRNCPCCGTALRAKPRNSKGRDKIVQKLEVNKFFPKK